MKAQHHGSKNTANLFIMIRAEHINTLDFHTHNEHVPNAVRNLLSPDAVCLDFALSSPPIVIGPQHPDPLVPKNEQATDILSSLRTLAQQASVAVYLSHRALPRPSLETICAATSNHALGHMDQHASIPRLYSGKGGRILYPLVKARSEPDLSADAGHQSLIVESPPSYDELGPGPPALVKEAHTGYGHSSNSQKKRRRPRSSSGSIDVEARPFVQHPDGNKDTSTGLDSKAENYEVPGMAKEVQCQLEGLEGRLANRLEHFLTGLFEKHKDKVVDAVERKLKEHRESVEKRLEEHEEEIQRSLGQARAEIESDVEDQLLDRKCELDQMVKDEREGLEENLREQLEVGLGDLEQALLERLSTARAVLHFE